jgi:hypothetical protein
MSYIQTKYPCGPYDPLEIQRVTSLNGLSGAVTLASSDTVHVNSNGSSLSLEVVGGSNPGGGGGGGGGGTFTGFPMPAFKRKASLQGFTVGSYILPPEDGWIQFVKSNPSAGTTYQMQVNDVTVWQVTPNVSYDIYSPLIPVKSLDYVSNTSALVTLVYFYPIRTEEEGNEGMG